MVCTLRVRMKAVFPPGDFESSPKVVCTLRVRMKAVSLKVVRTLRVRILMI
ncbi:MAG: hypothetical protein ACRCZF_19625 [Gemmataceae bacterium]